MATAVRQVCRTSSGSEFPLGAVYLHQLEESRDINSTFCLGMSLIILISSDVLLCIKCFTKITIYFYVSLDLSSARMWEVEGNRPSKEEQKGGLT